MVVFLFDWSTADQTASRSADLPSDGFLVRVHAV